MDDFQAQRQIAQAYADGVREGKEALKRDIRELAEDCKMLVGCDAEAAFVEALLVMFEYKQPEAKIELGGKSE